MIYATIGTSQEDSQAAMHSLLGEFEDVFLEDLSVVLPPLVIYNTILTWCQSLP